MVESAGQIADQAAFIKEEIKGWERDIEELRSSFLPSDRNAAAIKKEINATQGVLKALVKSLPGKPVYLSPIPLDIIHFFTFGNRITTRIQSWTGSRTAYNFGKIASNKLR
jgi:hypothetical protein